MSKNNITREKEWNNRFPKKPVIYNAQYDRPRDPRTFVFDKSYILESIIKNYGLSSKDDNTTILSCLTFVQSFIKYAGDRKTKGQDEFWQNPEDTVTLQKGDCEDGAILIKSLSLVAGVPDWKVRICAGHVKGGGHAYCTYVRDDDTQCIMDWCYWPNRLPVNERRSLKDEKNYYEVWFSWTRKYTFAPQRTTYSKGIISV